MAASSRSERLTPLLREIAACRICVEQPLRAPLRHEPRPVLRVSRTARILVAGQAPGARVHASGMPFTDPSGDRLRAWLAMSPEVFYDIRRVAIVPMGFCFPGYDEAGSDLPPRRECRASWHDRLLAALPKVELILMIGRYAQDYHLRRAGRPDLLRTNVTDTVRDWRAIAATCTPRLVPMPHPSWRNTGWLKRNPWFEAELLPELRQQVQALLALNAPSVRSNRVPSEHE